MNREILFRIKDRITDKWCYGFPINEIDKNNVVSFVGKDAHGGDYYHALADATTLTEFTGLTDKNGVKIFEGDIVLYDTTNTKRTNGNIHKVVFETRGGSCYFGITIDDIETWAFCMEAPAKLMEVIGNIYDNPELLKESK